MGHFNINITGVGGHGCERNAKPGQKLHARCGKFSCPDCAAYDFTQRLKQAGMVREGDQATGGEVRHSPACPANPVDDCTCNAIPKGAETYYTDANSRVVEEAGALPPGGKQYWRTFHKAEFTHWPDTPSAVVDDMLRNERKSCSF